jgi:hypothetical protein
MEEIGPLMMPLSNVNYSSRFACYNKPLLGKKVFATKNPSVVVSETATHSVILVNFGLGQSKIQFLICQPNHVHAHVHATR